MADEFVTRREFDIIRTDIAENKKAIDDLRLGNSTVAVLGTQIATITRDLSELKADMVSRFTYHEKIHADDERARSSSRK
jgi:hypothetical protein